jgi:uncharacterized protein (DUF697 family)
VNQSLLLHVVERLEGLVGKLPATIQKPILSELTPLKELFLQQRPPRFLFTGSNRSPLPQIISALFPGELSDQAQDVPTPIGRWEDVMLRGRGTVSVLDGRGSDDVPNKYLEEELERQPADLIFFLDDADTGKGPRRSEIENLITSLGLNDKLGSNAKVIAIVVSAEGKTAEHISRLRSTLHSERAIKERLLNIFSLVSPSQSARAVPALMSLLARELPNQARIEMVRTSQDRDAQAEIAQILVKSTTAICTAIGAQPIPLADLPILTTLQLVMVSGIMYISGRERSLRAATEFIAALGANVGAGMLLREGTRFILKFFPGWGNLICGMVAGAGTYAIGRAAIVFFLEGVSLKDARRIYLASRKKAARPALTDKKRPAKQRGHSK